jgi:hypothetical protein
MLSFRCLLLLLPLAACGGKVVEVNDASPPGNDAGPPPPLVDGSPPPVTDGGPPGQCNDLDPGSAFVPIVEVASDPPPFIGGGQSLTSGTYALTSLTLYTGPNGASGTTGQLAATARISSAKDGWLFEGASVEDNQAPNRSNSTAVSLGVGDLQVTEICPSAGSPANLFYGYNGSTLWLRVTNDTNQTADEQLTLIN